MTTIAGLIAELRERAGIYPVDGGPIYGDALLMLRIGDALEELLTADETRVRDISRLTIERDTARGDLAAAKGALEEIQTHVEYAVDVYNSSSPPVTAEMLRHANKLIEGVPKIIRDLQPKVETP